MKTRISAQKAGSMVGQKRKEVKAGSGSSGVIGKVVLWVLALQRKGADRLNGVVARLPLKKIKFGLLFFCLLAGGWSGYLIVGGIAGKKKATALYINHVSVPKHYDKAGEAGIGENGLDVQTTAHLRAIKTFMDSLAQHDQIAYDSLLRIRPGLMDTVRFLEEIYLTQ